MMPKPTRGWPASVWAGRAGGWGTAQPVGRVRRARGIRLWVAARRCPTSAWPCVGVDGRRGALCGARRPGAGGYHSGVCGRQRPSPAPFPRPAIRSPPPVAGLVARHNIGAPVGLGSFASVNLKSEAAASGWAGAESRPPRRVRRLGCGRHRNRRPAPAALMPAERGVRFGAMAYSKQ